MVCDTALTDIREKNQLFALLASAYLIADKTLKECPLSPEAAQAAFKGIIQPRITKADEHNERPSIPELNKTVYDSAAETEEKAPDVPSVPVEDSIFTVFAESENRVKGRNVAYKLKLRSSFTLEAGETVEPRKIIAEPSIEGVPTPVKLHVYDSEGKNKLDEIEISSKEYIFANYVGDELVYVHPTKAETDSCRVERKGNFITLTDKKTNKEKSIACDDCVVGVVPEQQNCGYIGIRTGGAFFSGYSNVRGFDTTYKGDDIVQVICTDQIYMLHKSGMVFKDMTLDLSSSVLYSDLRKYLEERQKHDYEQ